MRAIDSPRRERDICPRGRRHEDGAARDPACARAERGRQPCDLDRRRRRGDRPRAARGPRHERPRGRGGRDLPSAPRAHGQPPSHGRHRGRECGRPQRVPARERDRERRRGRRRAEHVDRARLVHEDAPLRSAKRARVAPQGRRVLPARGGGGADTAARCRKGEARHRPRAMRSRSCTTRRAVRHGHEPHGAAGPVPRRLRRHAGRPRAPRALLVPSRARGAHLDVLAARRAAAARQGRSLDRFLPRRLRGLVLPCRRRRRLGRALALGHRVVRARRMGDRRRRPRQRPVPPRARGDPPGTRQRPGATRALLRDPVLDVTRGARREPRRAPAARNGRRRGVQPPARRHAHRDAGGRRRLQAACPQSAGLTRDGRRQARRRRTCEAGARLPRRLRESSCRDVRGRRPSPVRRGHGRSPRTGRGARRATPRRERRTAGRPRCAAAVDPRDAARRRGAVGMGAGADRTLEPARARPSRADPRRHAELVGSGGRRGTRPDRRGALAAVRGRRLGPPPPRGVLRSGGDALPRPSALVRRASAGAHGLERRGPRLRRDRGGGAP